METNKEHNEQGYDIPKQTFNGKEYKLYKGERYFSRGCKRMHTEVWKHHKGEIPKNYHVHHVNGNTHDNRIENLNLVHKKLHLKHEGKKRFKNNPEFAKEFHAKGIEAAKEWHKSEEGRKWHREHWKKSIGKIKAVKKNCEECGKEYETKQPKRARFCHNNCKAKSNRRDRIAKSKGL